MAGVALASFATAVVAASLSFSQVAFDLASRPARWLLADRNPAALGTVASGAVRFGPATLLRLPLLTRGGDLRVNLRLVARVRGDLEVFACGRSLGSARAQGGTPSRLIFEDAAGGACGLDLRFALRPDPFDREREVDSSIELERVVVRSTQGLRLRPMHAGLLGGLVVAIGLAFAIAGAALARLPLVAGIAGIASLAWVAFDPVSVAAGAPWLAGAVLLLSVGIRVRKPAKLLASRLVQRADALSSVSPEPRASRLAVVALALAPALATCLWLRLLLGRGLLEHVPGLNDATNYWLEIAAFERAGWGGGYFSVAEYVAKSSLTRFGMHGPGFPVAYGSLARIFGWQAWSGPVFHLTLITLALLAYGLEARPSKRACALASVALLSFWPMPLFLPTNMQEGLHFAGAAALAALIRPAFGAPLGRARTASVVALVIGLSLVKPIWGMLWPPLLVLLAAHRSRRSQLLAFGAGIFLLIASIIVYGWLMAPFRDQTVSFVRFFQLSDTPAALFKTLRLNTQLAVQGTGIELVQRAASAGLAIALLLIALTRRSPDERREALFHAWNVGVPLAAALLVYALGSWTDYRILAVHLLLSCLLLLSSPSRALRRLALSLAVLQLAAAPLFVSAYPGVVKPNYVTEPRAIQAFAAAVTPVLKFRPGLPGWCNTLITTRFPYLYPEMVALPRGFGVTMVWAPERGSARRREFRSAYVLVDSTDAHPYWTRGGLRVSPQTDGSRLVEFGDWARFHVAPLAETPIGTLYRNLDSACPE